MTVKKDLTKSPSFTFWQSEDLNQYFQFPDSLLYILEIGLIIILSNHFPPCKDKKVAIVVEENNIALSSSLSALFSRD
jgi:hypothetical protein